MDHIDLTLPVPAENLALDEALLVAAEEGKAGEVLRFWELSRYAVILGSGNCLEKEVHEDSCIADGVAVERRCSGGGTVILGPGCLAYSLVLSYDRAAELRDVRHSYAFIMNRMRDALLMAARELSVAGTSDLAVGDWKISGNAQRRLRRFLLHHGTILYDFDLARISRYLKIPERQPDYRRRREHESFVTNFPLAAADIKQRLQSAWEAESPRMTWPDAEVRRLVAEKYATEEWRRRR